MMLTLMTGAWKTTIWPFQQCRSQVQKCRSTATPIPRFIDYPVPEFDELTARIGTLADLALRLPNMPNTLLPIIHEYRLNSSEDSMTYVKNLIGIAPTRGYELLARLIANKAIDLPAFNITAQNILGLAPHVTSLNQVSFDTLLETSWAKSDADLNTALIGFSRSGEKRNNVLKMTVKAFNEKQKSHISKEVKKQLHNNILIKILHFADIHHIKKFAGDLHLLGRACDNSEGLISFEQDYFTTEYSQELSRVQINLLKNFIRSSNLATLIGGRSSAISIKQNDRFSEAAPFLQDRLNGQIAKMLTTDSIWHYSFLDGREICVLKDILRHLPPQKSNIVESVLVNTYRFWQQNPSAYQLRYGQTEDHRLPALIRVYQELSNLPENIAKTTFNRLLSCLPTPQRFPIRYERIDRPQNIECLFYENILAEANLQASILPEQIESRQE